MKQNSGQSLVEMMVAVTILTLVAVALVFGTTLAIRNANFSRNQAQATKYAQEVMEWLRSERDQSWTNFESKKNFIYCFNASPITTWPVTGSCGGFDLGGMYKREAVLTLPAADKVQAQVTVYWVAGSLTHQSELTSYFTRWE